MSVHDQNVGFLPTCDQSDSQYNPLSGEDNRIRPYHHHHQRESSITAGVTLPSISPYDQPFSQHSQTYAHDQRPPAESYQKSASSVYQQDYNRLNTQQVSFSQSAPRQRTAIACRYCRRRKIRCSGFDQNPEGRCINCQRFQQECIFTPVSSQSQAFVPAHAVYPSMRNMGIGPDGRPQPMYPQGASLFGAHGQPLPTPLAQPNFIYDYPSSSNTGSYTSYGSDERNTQQSPSEPLRTRPQTEPRHSILPPPIPIKMPYSCPENVSHRVHNLDTDLRLPPVTSTSVSSALALSSSSSHPSLSKLHPPPQPTLLFHSHSPSPHRSSPIDGRSDPMNLGNIMERRPDTEIDRNMLGRLDRKG